MDFHASFEFLRPHSCIATVASSFGALQRLSLLNFLLWLVFALLFCVFPPISVVVSLRPVLMQYESP